MIIPMPNIKQQQFFRSRAKYTGYGGARGGGKSWSVRQKSKLMCIRYPGIRVLIVRQTYKELTNNHINILRPELVPEYARYNNTDKVFTFHNGSTITFMYCRNDGDLSGLQGTEYDVIFIDEATNLTEYQIKAITACMRGTNNFPKRCYMTCNPGGPGHQYIKRIFVDKRYEPGEYPDEYEFIQALVDDNIALMESQPEYKRQLEALPPKIREAWLHGSWDIYEGQFFEDFIDNEEGYQTRQWTHVIEPFEPPAHWKIYHSYDFGYAKPASLGWWAVDEEGVVYRIMEYYFWNGNPNEGAKLTPDQQFQKIREIERTHPWLKGKNITGPADPSIWDESRGDSVADAAAKHQVYFTPGDNNRIAGWMQMHYRMQFDENGYPMMYVFRNCKQFIRTIPLQVYSETHVEDLDTSLEDHTADEARYFLQSRPIKPHIPVEKRVEYDDPLNMNIQRPRIRRM